MTPENVALICANGHVATGTIRFSEPEEMGTYCAECGAPTLQSCPRCQAAIPGHDPMWLAAWVPPAFCISCGAAYPWTEVRFSAARETVELLDGLSDREREELRGSLDALIVNTPRTQVAALKVKLLIAKARGPAVASLAEAIRSFGVAAALKILFP